MVFIELFRSFLPLQNPIGFGASDFLEIALAAFLVACLVLRPSVEPWLRKLSEHTVWCMVLLAILPVALRLALLANHPVPTPDVYDEFGHLLVADTLQHLRLANPAHPLSHFFETFFVLQEPSYSSIYPLGQGLAMAIGRTLFGLPWAGVLLSTAALCSLCYWMLRGWTTPLWALAGGLLAVAEFGPLSQWMNSYWGGSFAATAGCLVFGAVPRLRSTPHWRDAALLGLGLAMHLITRPFESLFLFLAVAIALLHVPRKPLLATAAVLSPALFLILLHNQQVTGSWTTLPYALSQYQYGIPTSLTIQQNPTPHRDLTPQQEMDYKMQLSFHGPETDTVGKYFARLSYRLRFYRFFLLPPLFLTLAGFLLQLRHRRFAWVAGTVVLFALGSNFFPVFQFHYMAALTSLFVLICVAGLEQFKSRSLAWLLLGLCGFHFVFWYSTHLFDTSEVSQASRRFETWNTINHQNPERRIAINAELAKTQGKQLVFVRYWQNHIFQEEWVYNEADIDASRVVWARDLGQSEDEKLRRYYPDRTAWVLEADARPPKLTPYVPEPPPSMEFVIPPSTPPPPPAKPKFQNGKPTLRFEDVK